MRTSETTENRFLNLFFITVIDENHALHKNVVDKGLTFSLLSEIEMKIHFSV